MNTPELTLHQRMIRQSIRALFIVSSIEEMEKAKSTYPDTFTRACLDEMIATCRAQNVDNFGKTY